MKLNLGCGKYKIKGYINCDLSKEVNPDKIVDLEKRLPFKENSIEEVIANHVLEHINNFVSLMHELHRVCKKNSIIKIKTPFYSAWGQYNDPTHVRFFTPFTFNYFNSESYSYEVNVNKKIFEIKKVKINYGIGYSSKINWLMNPLINFNHTIYCRLFAFILPASEIQYELVVIK